MKSDIQIAQEAAMLPITQVAEKLNISADELELYGKYKAKLSDEYLKQISQNPDGKLILVTAINPTPAGEGKTTTTVGLGQAFGRLSKKAIIALREPSLGPWNKRRSSRRRLCAGSSYGGSEPSFYRRFSCDYLCK